MKSNKLLNLLLAPKITEKSMMVTEAHNAYTFKVIKSATKPDIKKAVEMAFEVTVLKVRTSTVNGKEKRSGKYIGRRASWKKAIITLMEGQSIELMDAN